MKSLARPPRGLASRFSSGKRTDPPRRPPPLTLRRQPRRNFPLQFFFCARPLKKIQKRKGRLKKEMSQGDLATALNVDRAYISNIENGRMNPTLSTLEKIANALEISSSELLK